MTDHESGPVTLDTIELAGTSEAMGEAFGEHTRGETRQLYERRLIAALEYMRERRGHRGTTRDVLTAAEACLPATRRFDPEGYTEFEGIARGAGLTEAQLFVTQGLTDLRDFLAFGDRPADSEGCSSFVHIAADEQAPPVLAGQTWDLMDDNMPFVRLVHRKPEDAPETLSITLTGCLSLIGLNSEGVCVGNTNLQTKDARPGVQYLSIIHRALRSRNAKEALEVVSGAPRAAAHYYYTADRFGTAWGIECSATNEARVEITEGTYVHCNHVLDPRLKALEVPVTDESTGFRQKRLSELFGALTESSTPVTPERARGAFSDREGGDNCICRYNTGADDISTNAAVIMNPHTGELHACRGQPDRGRWITRRIPVPFT